MATITVRSPAQSREGVSKKTGEPYKMYFQDAVLETDEMRVPIQLDIESEATAHAEGRYTWNAENDISVGRYGVELRRFWRLKPIAPPTAARAKE